MPGFSEEPKEKFSLTAETVNWHYDISIMEIINRCKVIKKNIMM